MTIEIRNYFVDFSRNELASAEEQNEIIQLRFVFPSLCLIHFPAGLF